MLLSDDYVDSYENELPKKNQTSSEIPKADIESDVSTLGGRPQYGKPPPPVPNSTVSPSETDHFEPSGHGSRGYSGPPGFPGEPGPKGDPGRDGLSGEIVYHEHVKDLLNQNFDFL